MATTTPGSKTIWPDLQVVLLPEVSRLPQQLTEEHKAFLNQFVGDPFRARLGKRGNKSSNGRTYTYDQLIGPFCDELYSDLSETARKQYGLVLLPGAYSYLTNHTSRASTKAKPKPAVVCKQRIYGHDIWRQDNPDVFEEMMKEYKDQHPNVELNVGTRRSVTIELFGRLSAADQAIYRAKATEQLATMRALGMLDGDAKAEYINQFLIQWNAMVKEAERVAGVKVNSQILYQDSNDEYNIRTIVTESMGELADTSEVERLVSWIKSWVQNLAAQNSKTEEPRPMVTSDPARDKFPLVPPTLGLKLAELQKILRIFFTMLWTYQGGQGKVPWEAISADLDAWIPSDRRPAGLEFGDPNDLRLAVVLGWLEHFALCQSGAVTLSKYIQFGKVNAGSNPIDPALSQESSRRLEGTGSNKQQWVLVFDETVTRCHALGGMEYSPESVEYAQFLTRAKAVAVTVVKRPNYLGLPTGPASPTAVIDGQERALLIKWCTALPAECASITLKLVDSINGMQLHSPLSTEPGVWVGPYSDAMPTILPSSPNPLLDGLQYYVNFWLHPSHFAPRALAEPRSRLCYIFIFVKDMIETSLIRHEPTGTLIGGYNGTVWVVRAVIKLILNYAAMNGELTPPTDQPNNFDISQFPLEDFQIVLKLARRLLEAIHSTTQMLATTSAKRQSNNIPTQSQELESIVQQPAAVPAHSSLSTPSPSAPSLSAPSLPVPSLPVPSLPVPSLSALPAPSTSTLSTSTPVITTRDLSAGHVTQR